MSSIESSLNYENLSLVSLLKTNKTQSSISDELSLLLKHTSPPASTHTHSIIIIKDVVKPIDLETWIKNHIKNETPNVDINSVYETFIRENSIHVLSVKNLNEINKCLESILMNIRGLIHETNTKSFMFTVCIEGMDKFWDTESFLVHESKRLRMSVINEIFVKLRLLKDISLSYEGVIVRSVVILDKKNNIIVNKQAHDFEKFVQMFMIDCDTVNISNIRIAVNKKVYSNNV